MRKEVNLKNEMWSQIYGDINKLKLLQIFYQLGRATINALSELAENVSNPNKLRTCHRQFLSLCLHK